MDSKFIEFIGSSLDDLRAFPSSARQQAGYQLGEVQHGRMPDDFKPMPTVGQGCYEIRVREESGAYRVIYVAKFSEAVYVLHCFQKKTQKTGRPDLELAEKRYRDLLEQRQHG
jgi:phage-related protein